MSREKNERKCFYKHLEILSKYVCKNPLFQAEIKRIVEKLRLKCFFQTTSFLSTIKTYNSIELAS